MSDSVKKVLKVLTLIVLIIFLLSTVVAAQNPTPKYIYYENAGGELVKANYRQAVEEYMDGDSALYEAIVEAIVEARENGRPIFVEDTEGNVVDYKAALDQEKSYLEAYDDPAFEAGDQNPVKELIIDPDSGEPQEVPIISAVTSPVFTTTSDSTTVTITLTGGTFRPGTITAADFTFSGANAAALAAGSFIRLSDTVVTITGLTLSAVANNVVTVKAATQATQASSVAAVANVNTGVTISTAKTTAGVSFVSGAFTSGLVTPAPASVVYNDVEDVIDVADGIKVTLRWVTDSALNGDIILNGAAKTATASVYVYQANSAQNTALILANAIRDVKNDTGYTGLLKATVNSVTGKVNIEDIEESASAPAAAVNAWKFEITTSNTPFTIAQDNINITQQVSVPVPGAKLHVDAVKAVYEITVTNGASASGNLIVNVKDVANDIDVNLSVALVSGDSTNEVANLMKSALEANATVVANYDVSVSGTVVTLTQKVGKAESIAVTLK